VYHYSVGSELTEFCKKANAKKMLIYHNITPPRFFTNINPQTAKDLEQGLEEIKSMRDCVDVALGVSEYDRMDLENFGFKNTGRIWLLLNDKRLHAVPNKNIIDKYDDDFVNIISVGRMSPNKKFEDVIKVFYYYQKVINRRSRLFLVGSIAGGNSYVEFLRGMCAVLSLKDVVFTNHITDTDLNGYYKAADIYITMSEHEGFCVPLLEAMHNDVPVIAFGSSAIPETLGGAGVCVKEKDFEAIAEMMELILTDKALKSKIIEKQKGRLKDFDREKLKNALGEFIKKLHA
jgi:glycosyltransferase involved in cell wall biosynthesis